MEHGLLVLGKRHIETLSFPLHPMILQILSTLQILPMQLTLNCLKCIVVTIILNEVEKRGFTVDDFLFAYKAVKTPSNPKAPAKQFLTFYLSARKYYVYSGKLPVDKDWETTGGLFVISGDWISLKFDSSTFPLVNNSLVVSSIVALFHLFIVFFYIYF